MTDIATTIEGIQNESTALNTHIQNLNTRIQNLMMVFTEKEKQHQEDVAAEKQAAESWIKEQREVLKVEQERVQDERAAWELEKEAMLKVYKFKTKIVKLNIGGTLMATRLHTLRCAGGMLASLFSGRFEPDKDEDNNVFLDFDGKLFSEWLNLLRQVANGEEVMVPHKLKTLCKFLQPNTKKKKVHCGNSHYSTATKEETYLVAM